MEAVAGLDAAVGAARDVRARFDAIGDGDLLAAVAEIETLGRIVDGLRAAGAAEVERRSEGRLGEQRLSFRHGARDGVELVQRTARIGHRDAKRRVAIGSALAPAVSLAGEALPSRFPAVAEAVRDGRIGVEAARVIVNAWKAVQARAVTVEAIDAMVESLIDTACTADTETVHDAAGWWALAIDPDGAQPRPREQRRKRALRIGRTLLDGSTAATLVLMPEHLALLNELLQSRRRGGGLIRVAPGGDADATTEGPEWREEAGPDGGEARTRAQQDYDTIIDVLEAGASAETATGTTVHETVVTVTAAELEARNGQAWAPGVMAGLPMPVVERRVCAGTTRLLVLGPRAEPLYLSAAHRLFSPAQRKALVLAAGGRCEVPGCRTPAPYLEAHHVDWYARDGGRTHVDNGIALCSHHHHAVHAQHPSIEIRRHRGAFFVVPVSWTGPPDPLHRAQTGPPGRRRVA